LTVGGSRSVSVFVVVAMWLCFVPQAKAETSVRAVTLEGRQIDGTWSGVDEAGNIVLVQEGQAHTFAPSALMRLYWPIPSPTSAPSAIEPATTPSDVPLLPTTVFLRDGSMFRAHILTANARHIELTTAPVARLQLPFSALTAVRFQHNTTADAQVAFDHALAQHDAAQDILFVVQKDRLTALHGIVESLTHDGGTFRWRDRQVPIDRDRVYGIVLASSVNRIPVPPSRYHLRDGSVWSGRIVGGDTTIVKLELVTGTTITLPVKQLREVQFQSDRMVFLSDLDPVRYEFEPFGITRWPYRKNRSVANRPMRIGNQVFDCGIGMHAQSKLVYALTEPFSQLAAVIGIDEAVGSLGHVVFRVMAERAEVFNSGPVTGEDSPRPILVPLNGSQNLELIVDFGEQLDVGDHANWGDVRLIR